MRERKKQPSLPYLRFPLGGSAELTNPTPLSYSSTLSPLLVFVYRIYLSYRIPDLKEGT